MSSRPAVHFAVGLLATLALAFAISLWTPGERAGSRPAPAEPAADEPASAEAMLMSRWAVESRRRITTGGANLSIHLQGHLDLQPSLTSRGLRGQLTGAQVATNSGGLDTAGIDLPFAVRLDPRGRPAQVGFAAGAGPLARRLIANLVAEIIVPADARGPALEDGPTGRARVRYTADGDTVTRTVEGWERAARLAGQADVQDLRVEVLAGTTTAQFDALGLVELAATERLRYRAERQGLDTLSEVRTTAARVPRAAGTIPPPGLLDWEDLDAGVTPTDTQAALDRALLDGADFADLTGDFVQLGPRARGQRLPRLAALFRLDPATIDEAVRAIRAGEPGSAALVGALSSAGTPAAQEALAGILGDAALETDLRKEATIQLGLVDAPTEAAAGALADALDDDALATPAALALGAVAHAWPEHVAPLRAGLARATDADDLRLYLSALGNAADPGARDALLAALTHADEQVRAAAAYGLRGLDGDDVDARLTLAASQDPAPAVRRRAEQALAVRARR